MLGLCKISSLTELPFAVFQTLLSDLQTTSGNAIQKYYIKRTDKTVPTPISLFLNTLIRTDTIYHYATKGRKCKFADVNLNAHVRHVTKHVTLFSKFRIITVRCNRIITVRCMVKLSDLLVDKSLHGLGTDQRDVIQSPV